MDKLIISMYSPGKPDPVSKASLPLASLRIALNILPTQLKAALAREQIDLRPLSDLAGHPGHRGELMQVATPRGVLTVTLE